MYLDIPFSRKAGRSVAVLAVPLLMALPAWGQQRASAGFYGGIFDAQGAVIPGAKITLVQVATKNVRDTVSNALGEYVFPLLPVGEYRLLVEHAGFKKYEQTGLLVQANDNIKVDVRLEIGETTTQITVEGTAVAVETSNATLMATVDSKRVVNLPLNGRNLADLTLLVPGVQSARAPDADAGLGAYSAPGVKFLSVNGSRPNNLKFTLDGGDNNDNLFNTNMAFPFPDAVQEFSIQTSNAGLDIGKSSAGAVNIITRSGTNEFHGDVFWFVRNGVLNARSFFAPRQDTLKRNQGGGTLGGPIIKNRLFLFGGYQRTWRRSVSESGQARTMPAPFRTGDFSSLLPDVVIKDPLTGNPFPGNIITKDRQSPAAQALLQFSPLPDPDGLTRFPLPERQDATDYILRADYRAHPKHSFVGRYFHEDFRNVTPMVPNNIHSVRRGLEAFTKNATLGYTYLVNSNLVADTHLTMAREVGHRTIPFPKTIADFGVKIRPSSNEISVVINGTSGINMGTSFRPALFARTNIEGTHAWHWVKGRHEFIWGADLMASRYNEYNVFNASGVFQFNGRFSGFDQADYILGALSLFKQGNGEIEFRRRHYQGFYGGDTFRLTPRLTLNFGLRWEPYTPMTDLNDREDQFRQDEYVKGTRSPHFVNAPPGLFYPGDKLPNFTVPKGGTESDLADLSPRVGFAWDLTRGGKMSIRGGYGIFYDTPEMWMLNNLNDHSPFSFQAGPFRDGLFDNPYAGRESQNLFPFAGDFDPKTPFPSPFEVDVLEPHFLVPYTQNWNLTVERRLGTDWLLRVGYVGTKSTHLMTSFDQNAPIYDFSKTLAQNQATIDQRRPRREYQSIFTLFSGLNQSYHSLQASLNKRFSHGFSILTSYTWSKNIDYNSENNNAEDNTIINPFNFFYTRGLADNDHTHRFVNSFVWNLPDPGRSVQSQLVSAIAGNWQLSGIVTLQSGRVFSISSSGDLTAGAAGGGGPFADLVGNLQLPAGRSHDERIKEYFNTEAVVQSRPGTYGTLGRNALRGPGFANTDLRVSRGFTLPFREQMKLLFLCEFFNLFNRPAFGRPDSTIRTGSKTFGTITFVDSDPRILQFGLKVEF